MSKQKANADKVKIHTGSICDLSHAAIVLAVTPVPGDEKDFDLTVALHGAPESLLRLFEAGSRELHKLLTGNNYEQASES